MISSAQACSNAESEVGDDWDFDGIRSTSQNMWEGILERVAVDVEKEDKTVVELLYSAVGEVPMLFGLLYTILFHIAVSYFACAGQSYGRKPVLGDQRAIL
jgi:hypothetical protein